MAATAEDDAQDKPLDPAVERVRRKLVRFMVVNLGLLFIALMAVAVAIVYRAGSREEQPPAAAVPELPLPAPGLMTRGEIALPQGARIAGHAFSGSRISLDVVLSDGSRAILIYDTAAGRLIGRFDVTTAP